MFCLKVFLLLVTTLKADTTLKAYRIHSTMTNWVNKFGGLMRWSIDNNQMVTGFYSVHDNRRKDRIWKFYHGGASSSGRTVTCSSSKLSDSLNRMDGPISYVCPSNHAINGFASNHHNGVGDRVWKIRCCKVTGARLVEVDLTGYLNSFGGVLDFKCEDDQVLIGVDSVHDNAREDRRWAALCARLVFAEGVTFSSQWSGWQNSLDGVLNFQPKWSDVITGLYSVHDNSKEDRRWKFAYGNTLREGRSIARSGHFCFPARKWTSYKNSFDGVLNFNCPRNTLLHAISSFNHNRPEDRKWRFKCCKASGFSVVPQLWTGYLNSFDGKLDYSCPATDQAIIGLSSYHDNGREDRRWKVRCARLIKRRTLS